MMQIDVPSLGGRLDVPGKLSLATQLESRREIIQKLIDRKLIAYDRTKQIVWWFGKTIRLTDNEARCFEALWDNLVEGNFPLRHQDIINRLPPDTNTCHITMVFKHNPFFRDLITGDHKKHWWLNIPAGHMAMFVPIHRDNDRPASRLRVTREMLDVWNGKESGEK